MLDERGKTSQLGDRRDRKRLREMHFAGRFVAALPELAGAALKQGDRPDFRLDIGGATYGLEVTAIVRPADGEQIGPKQRMEWKRAVERAAQELWREKGLPPMFVSIAWRLASPLAKKGDVAADLVEAVGQGLGRAEVQEGRFLHLDDEQLPPAVRTHVRGLSILRARTRNGELWASGWATFPEVQPDELQREIDRKSVAAVRYPSRRDGLWLLIYASGAGPAETLDISEVSDNATYEARAFDRVFFFDSRGSVMELNLASAKEVTSKAR